MRKQSHVAQRHLGESHDLTLRTGLVYGRAVYMDDGATLDDLRKAVTTFEDTIRIARRVLGGAHPLTEAIETDLQRSRLVLSEKQSPRSA